MADEKPSSVSKRSGEVSATGLRVLEVLAAHTRFPWPLFKSQCQQHAIDPAGIDVAGVRLLLDGLCQALAKLTDQATAVRARAEIEQALATS